jgi:hypothetical protein
LTRAGGEAALTAFRKAAVEFRIGGDPGRVRRALDGAMVSHPNHPLFPYLRAEWRDAVEGDPSGALADLEEALRLERRFVEARPALARVLSDLGLTRPARAEVSALLRILPPEVADRLAGARRALLAREGSEAIPAIDAAFRAMPADLYARLRKAPPMAGYLKSGGRLIPWASLGAAPREDLLAWA